MRIMTTEVGEHILVLRQSQVGGDQFHRDHLAIGRFRPWSALAQVLSLRNDGQQFVNRTETCDNKVVQDHGVPPQILVMLLSKVDSLSLFFGK